ncbi:DMT family transporter [Wenzhouxiangella sp. AB-CW3]|uniref:DMT family transporter n=1 Tax=Wenzhouxiangella sp. AB-CW3 TaxID=2771012 RepID=UPI00168BD719|nr:DMT family transporter [Wenzhouxiangella sp. AB-CW3]QOC21955.1 DMT family transporter [Wenzhouxiangella sp. AB-CW3]
MKAFHVPVLTALALTAFAANSILARLALTETAIDPVSFTTLRIVSGACVLWLILRLRVRAAESTGGWPPGLALLVYALAFSLAYLSLTAATGALILFGAVQITMIGWALFRGEPLSLRQWTGFVLATAGLVWLLLPGLAAPPPGGAALMIAAGIAWGIYTLLARGTGDPVQTTATNFLRASLPAILISAAFLNWARIDLAGAVLAVASGALASGLGYVIWYAALKYLKTSTAAVSQLSVPVITAIFGVLLLAEPVTLRLLLSGLAILIGIALVTLRPAKRSVER